MESKVTPTNVKKAELESVLDGSSSAGSKSICCGIVNLTAGRSNIPHNVN
jgi:hypothetical protein